MLERKRAAKGYRAVSGDEELGLEEEGVELNEGGGSQENEVVPFEAPKPTAEEELDNWDENVEDDWDEPESMKPLDAADDGGKSPVIDTDDKTNKKRDD